MNPKVSVVIPTYNRAEQVQKSVESVLEQSFTNLEVIVVDDGSSDDTGQTLKNTFGDRIRYYFQPNQGVSVARNKGIEEAKGEWIAFLDSDDLWEKEKLDWQFKALERFAPQCAACYTDVRFYNNSETRTMFHLTQESYRHEDAMGTNPDVLRLLVRPGGAGMVVCLSSFLAHRKRRGNSTLPCCTARIVNSCFGWRYRLVSATSTFRSCDLIDRLRRLAIQECNQNGTTSNSGCRIVSSASKGSCA
jgi:glycosyltransferase involved in cell wall biosynthesis